MLALFDDFLDCLSALHAQVASAVEGLPPEALDWTSGPEMNSINVLVSHLVGAERYLIGDLAAGVPSGRDRPAEFRARGLTSAELQSMLNESRQHARALLANLDIKDLETARYSPIHERTFTAGWGLLHALEHTALHLGHIQMTRQLWDQQASSDGELQPS
jgi:hypothetical protein